MFCICENSEQSCENSEQSCENSEQSCENSEQSCENSEQSCFTLKINSISNFTTFATVYRKKIPQWFFSSPFYTSKLFCPVSKLPRHILCFCSILIRDAWKYLNSGLLRYVHRKILYCDTLIFFITSKLAIMLGLRI